MEVVLGPPGTGKTTHLINLVIESGLDPSRIGFLSFTRKAALVACDRMGLVDLPYFRTLHSMCFQGLGLGRNSMMPTYVLPDVYGLPFRASPSARREMGDVVDHLLGLARTSLRSLDEVHHDMRPEVSLALLKRSQERLDQYKVDTGLLDYTDLLELYLTNCEPPALDLLCADEAQDFSPLQWKVFDHIGARAGRSVVAGDDDQSIYGWSGADARFLIERARLGETTVLSQSYRVPSEVQDVALSVINRVGDRYDKVWAARPGEGIVQIQGRPPDLREGQWLVLARSGYQLKPIKQDLLASGVPFTVNGELPVNESYRKAATLWDTWQRTGERDKGLARACRRYLVDATWLAGDRTDKPWHLALRRGRRADRLWLEAAGLDPEVRVNLSTIHASKGDEADNVMLLNGLSRSAAERFLISPDDEVRVFYVGLTRARQRLVIVPPEDREQFPIRG